VPSSTSKSWVWHGARAPTVACRLRALAPPSTFTPNLHLHHTPSTPIQLHHIASWSAFQHSPKMTHQLPPMLLNLFAPRPPLRWVEPIDHAPEKRCTPKISGVGQYMQALREYKDNDNYVPTDSWLQKRDKKKMEKKERQERLLTEVNDMCTPSPTRLHLYFLSITSITCSHIHRQAQRRPQGSRRRFQDALRVAPRLRHHLGRPRTRIRPLRSHRAHQDRRRYHCAP
jgi:hypothetical protein